MRQYIQRMPRISVAIPAIAMITACHAATSCGREVTQAASAEATIAQWIAEVIPADYEKREDWGRTRRVTVGLDVDGNLLKPRIRTRKKDVPHGVWKHYRVWLLNRDNSPRVRIEDLRATAPGRVRWTVKLNAPVAGWFRTRLYEHGIHLGTFTAEGRSTVHVTVDCELGVRVEGTPTAPAVIVEPVVHRTEVRLTDFELMRISDARGPAVRELGKVIKHVLDDELEPPKLTAKLNRSIAKKQDRLRLELADLVDWPTP